MTLTTAQRGYGWDHRIERNRWVPLVAAGQAICARCGRPIHPAQEWHLDHNYDRTGYLGVSHAHCNRRAGAKLGAQRRWSKPRRVAITANRW
jgi:hypothetical protein